ncbi:hypothetical protein SDC9_01656 [bioreactor metagenome]|uniref:Uncharacterized protein n=1 Tax=bioreactor metagenome TaxID=1076179 RepID=A0A644SND2_9ZZZZ
MIGFLSARRNIGDVLGFICLRKPYKVLQILFGYVIVIVVNFYLTFLKSLL